MKPVAIFNSKKTIDENFILNRSETDFSAFLKELDNSSDKFINEVISRYKETITKIEKEIWSESFSSNDIATYQKLFRDLEKLYKRKSTDERYDFKIIIPVADRPQHLQQCLDSLLKLCQHYQYGGFTDSFYSKISVLIADDSKHKENISAHKRLCKQYTQQGIKTDYFGLEEQHQLVSEALKNNAALKNIISAPDDSNDVYSFSHKGASVMRNITHLKLKSTLHKEKSNDNTLIYFVDSDQEFCISTEHESNLYGINYFHYLNHNFKENDITALTGKVVGDPPVSPSVMAGTFQKDVTHFLKTIDKLDPDENCQFHTGDKSLTDDAAYHDMADLFGFEKNETNFNYHCDIAYSHTNSDCFDSFSEKLNHFFYGEHPTRKTYFKYEKGFNSLTPARTVYTGNYVIKLEALDHFIPFASLKLRMAGPVLGRLLQAELNTKFVSANLPMLHKRTVEESGKSEFRSGVDDLSNRHSRNTIELSNEFVRQFYGDVMLFSVIELIEKGYPETNIDTSVLLSTIQDTHKKIKTNYANKHLSIMASKKVLNDIIMDESAWWNNSTGTDTKLSIENFKTFLHNIDLNFDDNSAAYKQITSKTSSIIYLEKILSAIQHYKPDNLHWKKIFN